MLYLSLSLWWMSFGWAETRVSVVIPAEHQAMEDILSGIQSELDQSEFKIRVYRAHGDLNILAALIRQIQHDGSQVVVPIGTMTSQMTLSMIHDRPVVCCAAQVETNDNVYSVDDKIVIWPLIDYLKDINNWALCYSAQDKVIDEVFDMKQFPFTRPMKVHERMISTLQDVPFALQSLPSDVQAIVILKDLLMVSAIPSFLEECEKRHIPLIVSDDGSLKAGATMALTISERSIGQSTGQVVRRILKNDCAGVEHVTVLDTPDLFVNMDAFQKQKVLSVEILEKSPWTVTFVEQMAQS